MRTQYNHVISGRSLTAVSGETVAVLDPANGSEFARIASGSKSDVDHAVRAARSAFEKIWSRVSALERGRMLLKLSEIVLANIDALARLESRDTGKPLKQGRADVAACARYLEFYGGAADKIHGETIPFLDGYTVMVLNEPYGVTGHIIPWNYPLQIGARNIGASLAAGNCVIVKPSEEAGISIVRLAELALEAGVPEGVLNVITGLGTEAGAALAGHPGIDHISFTGSPATGTVIQRLAAKNNVPVLMELGGKSPQIVFSDANLEAAVPFLVNGIIQNAGQTCSAGSRLLVQNKIYDQVVGMVGERFRAVRVGTYDMDLDCGPLINRKQHQRVTNFLDRATERGVATAARGVLAPNLPEGGFFVRPTLLENVGADDEIAREEVFGPVLSAIPFSSEEEAVQVANSTSYGLVTGIWTSDGGRQLRLARAVRAGQIFINNFGAGGGVELPFGGMKRSGFGREKGLQGLKELTVMKTIAIKHG